MDILSCLWRSTDCDDHQAPLWPCGEHRSQDFKVTPTPTRKKLQNSLYGMPVSRRSATFPLWVERTNTSTHARSFPRFAPVALVDRPVSVVERSLESRHGERPVAAPRNSPVVKIEFRDSALSGHATIASGNALTLPDPFSTLPQRLVQPCRSQKNRLQSRADSIRI